MKLTIISCLNEEKTIPICIQIAKENKVKIIKVKGKGYGNTLIEGTKNAKGKCVITGDADDSYNFLELKEFLEKLEEGYDLGIGNRYQGKIEKGAMKFTHKWIGTPILSFFVRKKYHVNIYDINCGLRGYVREKMIGIDCQAKGMEYAAEMIIKAQQNNLKIIEIPINFYKDKRNKKSHLKTISDGIRHLQLIHNNK